MASSLVGQHQITTFSTPVNGTTPIDANQVRGNDNTIKTSYDAHDSDGTIHLQDSTLAARPAAGTVGTKWFTNDGFRLYYDDGANWQEAAYLPTAGGTLTGGITIPAASSYAWLNRSMLSSPSDGTVQLLNHASTGFTTLYFGGTSSSFPALKVSGTGLLVRLGDDSGNTALTALQLNAGPSLTSAVGDALRVRADSAATSTVEAARIELHMTAAATGSKYGLEVNAYADNSSGAIQSMQGIRGTVQTSASGGTITGAAVLSANAAIVTGTTVTALSMVQVIAPTGGGTITTLKGIDVGNMGAAQFAITTGTGIVQFGDVLITTASTTTVSGLRLPHGSAPTSPVNGDVWTTTAGLFVQINGSTVGPLT